MKILSKCDGNHSVGQVCVDPQCWQEDNNPYWKLNAERVQIAKAMNAYPDSDLISLARTLAASVSAAQAHEVEQVSLEVARDAYHSIRVEVARVRARANRMASAIRSVCGCRAVIDGQVAMSVAERDALCAALEEYEAAQ